MKCTIGWPLVALASACAGQIPVLGEQAPIQVHLVVHVDPVAREGLVECERTDLDSCGTMVRDSYTERSENLVWLVDRWQETGRTLDLQLGPEMASAWATGDSDVEMAVQDAVRGLVETGAGELGVHVHSVLPELGAAEPTWGDAPRGEGDDTTACASWSGNPIAEEGAPLVEEIVAYGVDGASLLAEQVDAQLHSFTGHLPRSMAGKILVVVDPDGLDPETTTEFNERFEPTTLGSAYSECFLQSVDVIPFELYRADLSTALSAGNGPVVVPGERVVGSMADHLDASADGSAGAVQRRLLQLLLEWRLAGLRGEPDRPWVYTFHTHLFQLDEGEPQAHWLEARDRHEREGVALRGDLEAVAGQLDRWAQNDSWQGVSSGGEGVVQWVLPSDLGLTSTVDASGFSYGDGDSAPQEGFDPSHYPYAPLVADRMANSHLIARSLWDGVDVYTLLRCPSEWAWGVGVLGYGCQDQSEPEQFWVMVAEEETCLTLSGRLPGALQAASISAEQLGTPDWCEIAGNPGVLVPVEGLMVEALGRAG